MSIEKLGKVSGCWYCEKLCHTYDNKARRFDCLECDSQPKEACVDVNSPQLSRLVHILDLLPNQPNAAQVWLLEELRHTHIAGVGDDIDVCKKCGKDLRHEVHLK